MKKIFYIIILFICGLIATTNQKSYAQCAPDVTPPMINNCPANITVNVGNGVTSSVVNWTPPTATDGCSVPINKGLSTITTNGNSQNGVMFNVTTGISAITITSLESGFEAPGGNVPAPSQHG